MNSNFQIDWQAPYQLSYKAHWLWRLYLLCFIWMVVLHAFIECVLGIFKVKKITSYNVMHQVPKGLQKMCPWGFINHGLEEQRKARQIKKDRSHYNIYHLSSHSIAYSISSHWHIHLKRKSCHVMHLKNPYILHIDVTTEKHSWILDSWLLLRPKASTNVLQMIVSGQLTRTSLKISPFIHQIY